MTKETGAMLADLVSLLPSGDVKELLMARIRTTRSQPGAVAEFLQGLSLGEKWRALKRVPGSTWLLAGVTVIVSLVGYLFMKGRSSDE